MEYMKKVLTIAGSDCSGGAGIQADLKTMTAHRIYGMSVITALTAQNTTGVYGVLDTPAEFVAQQIDCIMTDIRPDAIKIGMVSSVEIIEAIAQKLVQYQCKQVVLDPVMVSTSGSKLLSDHAVDTLIQKLFPLADIITPNLPEAECLAGFEIHNKQEMERAAAKIHEDFPGAVLIKGGHFDGGADDLLSFQNNNIWFVNERIDNPNTHGTGCTLSSAIACNLASGFEMEESVRRAKNYITDCLKAQLDLGQGSGPLNHCCNLS